MVSEEENVMKAYGNINWGEIAQIDNEPEAELYENTLHAISNLVQYIYDKNVIFFDWSDKICYAVIPSVSIKLQHFETYSI